jgi:hypothetical protein
MTDSGRLIQIGNLSDIERITEENLDRYFVEAVTVVEKALKNPDEWVDFNAAAIVNRLQEADEHNAPIRIAREKEYEEQAAQRAADREMEAREREQAFNNAVVELGNALHRGERGDVSKEFDKNPLLALFDLYEIDVPLRTRGWINKNVTAAQMQEDGTLRTWGTNTSTETYLNMMQTLRNEMEITPPEQQWKIMEEGKEFAAKLLGIVQDAAAHEIEKREQAQEQTNDDLDFDTEAVRQKLDERRDWDFEGEVREQLARMEESESVQETDQPEPSRLAQILRDNKTFVVNTLCDFQRSKEDLKGEEREEAAQKLDEFEEILQELGLGDEIDAARERMLHENTLQAEYSRQNHNFKVGDTMYLDRNDDAPWRLSQISNISFGFEPTEPGGTETIRGFITTKERFLENTYRNDPRNPYYYPELEQQRQERPGRAALNTIVFDELKYARDLLREKVIEELQTTRDLLQDHYVDEMARAFARGERVNISKEFDQNPLLALLDLYEIEASETVREWAQTQAEGMRFNPEATSFRVWSSDPDDLFEIGRASCRDRVFQPV